MRFLSGVAGTASDPPYQEGYRVHKRYADARRELHDLLEAGDLEAAILDPWTGNLHRASAALWRRPRGKNGRDH
jgi:hypothetical protein